MQLVLDAIVEPKRREILRLVRETSLSAGAIAAHFPDVTRPTMSSHLRMLREAGLLVEQRDGTRRLYRTQPGPLAELREFVEGFWPDRLKALKAEAEREQGRISATRD